MKLTKGLNLVIGFLSVVSVVGMLSVSFILPEFMNSENIIQHLKLRNMLQSIFMYLAIFLVISYLIYTLIGGAYRESRITDEYQQPFSELFDWASDQFGTPLTDIKSMVVKRDDGMYDLRGYVLATLE